MNYQTARDILAEAIKVSEGNTPDIGANLRGMPKKSGRKHAYALKQWGKGRISNAAYRVAAERNRKKATSQMQRVGKNLDSAMREYGT